MLIPSMDISRLMVHAEEIEEQKLKQVGKELRRTNAEDGNSSKTIFEVQDNPRFKKCFPNQSPSTIPTVNKGKGSTPSLRRIKVVVIMLRSLIVLNMEKNINAGV